MKIKLFLSQLKLQCRYRVRVFYATALKVMNLLLLESFSARDWNISSSLIKFQILYCVNYLPVHINIWVEVISMLLLPFDVETLKIYISLLASVGIINSKIFLFSSNFRLMENYDLLKSRLQTLKESKIQLDTELKHQNAYHRSLDREMNTLKPEIMRLYKQREDFQA